MACVNISNRTLATPLNGLHAGRLRFSSSTIKAILHLFALTVLLASALGLVPTNWSPVLAGEMVTHRLVNSSAPQVKGAYDAEFVRVGQNAYVVAEANDVKIGEGNVLERGRWFHPARRLGCAVSSAVAVTQSMRGPCSRIDRVYGARLLACWLIGGGTFD
jgi:hypothetical protein